MVDLKADPFLEKARRDAARWAYELLNDYDGFVVFDTETTGLGDDDEIIQFGVLSRDGAVLLDALVQPRKPIPAVATAIHGITDEMVRLAAPYSVGLHSLICDLFNRRRVVIYNAAYDLRMLKQTSRAHPGFAPQPHSWECAMLKYSQWVGEWNGYRQGFKWQKLPAVNERCAHSAVGDCRSTLAVIQRMAESL